jgi:hypothetical protein
MIGSDGGGKLIAGVIGERESVIVAGGEGVGVGVGLGLGLGVGLGVGVGAAGV